MKHRKELPKGSEILTEQYSDSTRGHRKSLVAVSAISIFIASSGAFPSEIRAIGFKIGVDEKQLIIWGLVVSVLYFLISFLVHFWPESVYRDVRIHSGCLKDDDEIYFPWQMALVSNVARSSVYIIFPLLIAGVALISLLWVSLSPESTSFLASSALWVSRILSIVFFIYVFIILLMLSFEMIGSLMRLFGLIKEVHSHKNGDKKDNRDRDIAR